MGQRPAARRRGLRDRASDDSLEWPALRTGMVGFDFEVHEPPEHVERCAQLAARLGQAAGRWESSADVD